MENKFDFSKGNLLQSADTLFGPQDCPAACLKGATILNAGFPPEGSEVEGGGLAFDYIPAGSTEKRRLVIGNTELGTWIQWEGVLP